MQEPRSSITTANQTTPQAGRRARAARALGALTVVGIVLYVALDVLAQALPPHYSPVGQAESDLAVGPYGYVMTVNFVVRGLLSLALVAGLAWGVAARARSRVGLALIGLWGVGALVLAAFPADVGTAPTLHGTIHLVVALAAFAVGALGELLVALRLNADARWMAVRPFLLGCAVAALLALLVLVLGARPLAAHQVGGLAERVFLGLALLWMLVAGLRLVRLGR